MMNKILFEVEQELRKKRVPNFKVGDTVDVHLKIREGDKERIQIFNGIVIARKGAGARETFTVRRIVQGEGVERIFPLHSPHISNVVVKRRGQTRRAKLYYLRKRTGRSARVKELLGLVPGSETILETPPAELAPKATESNAKTDKPTEPPQPEKTSLNEAEKK